MGSRVTRAAAHLPAEEVKRRMLHDPRFWCRQCWLIIYQALIALRKAEEIALHTGVPSARGAASSPPTLGWAWQRWKRQEPAGVDTNT